MSMLRDFVRFVVLALSIGLLGSPVLQAQVAVPASPPAALPALAADETVERQLERERLAAFVEGVVQGFRQRDRIAGAVVGIVRDGEVWLLEGYGHARLDPDQAVDPENDLFRIASISKTFTYALLMQQIEQGRLGLDDPVNRHLPQALQLPDDGHETPILVRHLLTHTAGFEDLALGHLFVDEPIEVLSVQDYLARHRPRRVRPPGEQAVYSNYGIALLGALLAEVSGLTFEELAERALFEPLGMRSTTFREPGLVADPRQLDATLAARLATGFTRQQGGYVAMPFEHIAQTAASGGASATATDMTRWMLALLGDGSLDGQRVLSPESNARFREALFRNHEGVNGIAHGFITDAIGPYFAFGHGGATLYFHSNMVLVPELGLGVFISTNTSTGRRFAREFPAMLVEFLAPRARPQDPAAVAVEGGLERYAGNYLANRRPWRSADAILVTQRNAVTQVTVADDQLVVSTPNELLRFAPLGEHRFREVEGHGLLAFVADGDGRIQRLVFGNGINSAERIGFFGHPQTPLLLVLASTLFGLILLFAFMARGRQVPPVPQTSLWAGRIGLLAGLVWAGFGVLAVIAWLQLDGLREQWMFVYPTALWQWLLALAPVVALLTLIMALLSPWAWRSGWPWPVRAAYLLALATFALTVWQLWRWNLLTGPV